MKQSKKYDYRVVQNNDAWTAEITRRVTSRVTVVSKDKGGFTTEAEAQAWGQAEVETFLKKTNKGEMEKRRVKEKQAEAKAAKYEKSIAKKKAEPEEIENENQEEE
ncbi:MAG: DUF3622 domain-containing protein [Gammaproteobacteria bacterium]|nr:DUF3622 domain-containing protein [Gammaproteobacteria bacterium]